MPIREWLAAPIQDVAGTAVAVAAVGLALVVLRALLHRTRVGHRLDAALTLMIVGTAAALVVVLEDREHSGVALYARAVAVAALAIGLVRIALVLLVDVYFGVLRGRAVSAIVRDVGSMLAYFLIILVVLRAVLDINLASLVTTSAVLTAILGLALQDSLSSVVSGLVLEIEEPFTTSDWVRVGSFEGQVVQIGWRTTRLRTRVNEVVVLPNIYIAREPLVNYTRPDPRYRDTVYFRVGYDVPPNAVKEAVLPVLRKAPSVLADPAPEVLTWQYDTSAILYAARFWLVDFAALLQIRDRVMTDIWYALRRAGVRLPFPASDIYVRTEVPIPALERGDVATALARAPLLAPLAGEELDALAARVRRLPFAHGEAIVREGDAGDSLYIIESGEVDVRIGLPGAGTTRTLAHLRPGDVFGEMSLLAGEPRSATVVADSDVAVIEVDRTAFQTVLAANPALLEPISQLAAHRSADQRERRAEVVLPPFEEDAAAQRLLTRIKAFFGI